MTRRAAAIPARRLTRSGTSCGKALSPTTRFTRCARSRARRSDARASKMKSARATVPQPARLTSFRRRALVAGIRSNRAPRCRQPNGPPLSRSSCSSRYGVLTREVAGAEGIYGGFSAVYNVLKAMEDAGRIRRGYFVAEVGATQFALPAALELMRSLRETPDEPETLVLSATDPANPYGTMLKWPEQGNCWPRGDADGWVAGHLRERRSCGLCPSRRTPVARLRARRRAATVGHRASACTPPRIHRARGGWPCRPDGGRDQWHRRPRTIRSRRFSSTRVSTRPRWG